MLIPSTPYGSPFKPEPPPPPQSFRKYRVSFTITTYRYWSVDVVRRWISRILTERELITLDIKELTEQKIEEITE